MSSLKITPKTAVNTPLAELIAQADRIRREHLGNKLDICNILNAKSGACSEDCKFCAQSSRHKTGIPTYQLKNKKDILEAAKYAQTIGAERFDIVTSGNRPTQKELEAIIEAISDIKNKIGIKICASLGALEREELKALKRAGLLRYHHNIETSPKFYSKIVSTHDFSQRIRTIENIKSVGLEICSGGIIGMGESWQDRIDMAYILRDLEVDSVPLNILVPIKGTPFDNLSQLSCEEALRTICVFRLILKDKTIKIAAGRETILKDFQGMGFMAGANGMLIGGYLTIPSRDVCADWELIKQIKRLWKA